MIDNLKYLGQNGIYFEQEGQETYMVLRSYVTGSVVNTRVPRNQWNGDQLNGIGVSGKTLDTSKGNIFWCDSLAQSFKLDYHDVFSRKFR